MELLQLENGTASAHGHPYRTMSPTALYSYVVRCYVSLRRLIGQRVSTNSSLTCQVVVVVCLISLAAYRLHNLVGTSASSSLKCRVSATFGDMSGQR
jgi:hypothetical protein